MKAAARHELALHGFAQPGLPLLLSAGSLVQPLRRVPKLGWLIADPEIAREVHNDSEHFSIVHEGASGHLWAQMLGDFFNDYMEGPGHLQFRSDIRDLFAVRRSEAVVQRAVGPMLATLTEDLAAGRAVEIGDFSRIFTGRVMFDLMGLPAADDSHCLEVFDAVERLANLAKRSWATTTMPPRFAARGKRLAQQISQKVPDVFDSADPDTVIGRCRERGMGVRETRAFTTLMVVAGTITLASTLGRMVALLHDSGAQHQLLADRRLIPVAVRESLRVTSSMPIVGRGVVKDRMLAGRHLRAGDRVKILTWSINNQLGGFDLDLESVSELRQLWFGGGRHMCIGISLSNGLLAAVLKALTQPNRPWRITERRYRRNVFVPLYDRLSIQLTS